MFYVFLYIVTVLNFFRIQEDVLYLVYVYYVYVLDSSGYVIQDFVKYCQGLDVVLIKFYNYF